MCAGKPGSEAVAVMKCRDPVRAVELNDAPSKTTALRAAVITVAVLAALACALALYLLVRHLSERKQVGFLQLFGSLDLSIQFDLS